MTDDSGDQQELSENAAEPDNQTRQEQIIKLYNADNLPHVAIGFWAKFIIEGVIVAVPIVVLVIVPGFILAYLNIGPVTSLKVIFICGSFSVSVLLAVWCFTESTIEAGEEGGGNIQD